MDKNDGSGEVQRLVDLLYGIYLKTSLDRQISERNCQITEQILQEHRNEPRLNESTSELNSTPPPPKIIKCTCRFKPTPKQNEIEKKLAENIDSVLATAKQTRMTPLDKLKSKESPYISKSTKLIPRAIKKPVAINKSTKSQPLIENGINGINGTIHESRLKELHNILDSLDTKNGEVKKNGANPIGSKLKTHSVNCPMSKNKMKPVVAKPEKSSVGMLSSLGNIRIPGEIQKALKMYYNFVKINGLAFDPTKPKAKNMFLTKLDEHNIENWDHYQKQNYSIIFELDVYLKQYNLKTETRHISSLCRFYNDVDTLVGIQQSLNRKNKTDLFYKIFEYLNNQFFDYVNSPNFDVKLLPAIFKTFMNIVNVYNKSKTSNIAVIKV